MDVVVDARRRYLPHDSYVALGLMADVLISDLCLAGMLIDGIVVTAWSSPGAAMENIAAVWLHNKSNDERIGVSLTWRGRRVALQVLAAEVRTVEGYSAA